MKTPFISYKNPITIILVLIILGGMFSYSRMQSALFPEITFPKIKIIADAGQQPVNKMMITVTRQLENAVKQVPDLERIRSITSRGSCEISAYMRWNSNLDVSQQRIESKISEIRNTLPPDVQITVERMNPSILPVIGYTMEAPGMSPIEQNMLAEYTIKPFLSQVPGVSEIRIIGGKTKEYWLTLDIAKMSAFGITPDSITNALNNTNFIKSNGYLTDYRQMYLTITDAVTDAIDDVENLVIRNDGKRIVRLKDITQISIEEAKEYVKINANGHAAVLLAVVKQPDANVVEMSAQMEKKLEDLSQLLPAGVHISPYYVQADFVKDSIRSVTDSIWIGLALAIIVAIMFLRSLKASAVILITIPVTLFLTLIVLYFTGQTFNIMTLGAMAAAIGLIIDDAIVIVEQIHRTHEEFPQEPTGSLIQKAIHYLFPAMAGSSLSTIVIFLPFILMTGVAGAYFKVLTDTMIITLVCSFFVTWLGLPVIYLLLSRKKMAAKPGKQNAIEKPHEVHQQRWVSFFIKRWYFPIGIVLVLIISIVLILPKLQTGFLPEMDEGSIVLDYNSPPGTSLDETDKMLQEVEKIIRSVPDVEAYSRRTGTQMGFFITEPNSGDYLIQLKKNRNKTTDEVIDEIRSRIESSQPALTVDFGQVIGDMLGDLMTSVQPVEIKIFGNDQKTLQRLSQQVSTIVSGIPGTADVFDGIVIAGPSISIEPDEAKLAQYGITPAGLQSQLQTALEGSVVGTVFDKQQLSNLRMIYPENKQMSVQDLRNSRIFVPGGRMVSATELVKINLHPGDAEIERENLESMGVVTARLDNRDLGSVMKDIQKAVKANITLPIGYNIAYGGAYADQQKSFQELLLILFCSSMLVFCVILFLFRDFKVAAIILFVAVLGISGSYLALFLTNTPLNVGSYTGLIMIVGIIAENAIFTFLQFRDTWRQTGNTDNAIVYAISTRLRPKLMTALGAIIALLPLALGIGTGAKLHQPLAIAVIGGFLIALPLLLIVLPYLLHVGYRKKTPVSQIS